MVNAEKINLKEEKFTGGLKVIVRTNDEIQEGTIALADQPLASFAGCVLKQLGIESDFQIIAFCKAKSEMVIKLLPVMN